MATHYKTPLKKLVTFFRRSRDSWKEKTLQSKKELKLCKNRIRFLETSKAKLKQEVMRMRKQIQSAPSMTSSKPSDKIHSPSGGEDVDRNMAIQHHVDFDEQLQRHSYSVKHITLWISLVLSASARMRCASRAMELFMAFFGLPIASPTWHTGRLWLMRLGYYKLNRPKDLANDWIWIIDHSIQIGVEKCFLILGIRLRDVPENRPLKHEDVEPIDLVPVTKSNGEIVYQQLEQASKKTGIPAEIIGDHGSDIKSGVDRFCLEHHETVSIYDIKHKTASILKREFEKDDAWLEFKGLCSQTKSNVQQTALACFAPPNQRSKARYMNIDTLINWSVKILDYIDDVNGANTSQLDSEMFKTKLRWVEDFRYKINEWSSILNVVGLSETFVRTQGLYKNAHIKLGNTLNQIDLSEKPNSIKQEILKFVQMESKKAKPEQKLLGSSEIIESLLGKQKVLEQEQSKSGFTGLILTVAAVASSTTSDVIKKAMETVKTKNVIEWVKNKIGKSVQAKRNEIFSCAQSRNKNGTNNAAAMI